MIERSMKSMDKEIKTLKEIVERQAREIQKLSENYNKKRDEWQEIVSELKKQNDKCVKDYRETQKQNQHLIKLLGTTELGRSIVAMRGNKPVTGVPKSVLEATS